MWICLLHLFYSSLCDEETTTRAKLMLLLPNLPIYLSAIYEEVPGQQLTSIRPACNFVVSCSFFLSGLWSLVCHANLPASCPLKFVFSSPPCTFHYVLHTELSPKSVGMCALSYNLASSVYQSSSYQRFDSESSRRCCCWSWTKDEQQRIQLQVPINFMV